MKKVIFLLNSLTITSWFKKFVLHLESSNSKIVISKLNKSATQQTHTSSSKTFSSLVEGASSDEDEVDDANSYNSNEIEAMTQSDSCEEDYIIENDENVAATTTSPSIAWKYFKRVNYGQR